MGKHSYRPGEVKTIPQWQKSKGNLICTAALDLSTNQVTHFFSNKKDTKEMIKLLNILIKKYSAKNAVIYPGTLHHGMHPKSFIRPSI